MLGHGDEQLKSRNDDQTSFVSYWLCSCSRVFRRGAGTQWSGRAVAMKTVHGIGRANYAFSPAKISELHIVNRPRSCHHQMAYFEAKMQQIRFQRRLRPNLRLEGEVRALSQTPGTVVEFHPRIGLIRVRVRVRVSG